MKGQNAAKWLHIPIGGWVPMACDERSQPDTIKQYPSWLDWREVKGVVEEVLLR
jgi:hypothetical protein